MRRKSLEDLVELVKRTGDRLIVHDSFIGDAIAIMSVDDYENLVLSRNGPGDDFRNLSDKEMLEKINHDIAVWRARKDDEEEWEKEIELDEEIMSEPPFDPFRELDSHTPAWHSAGSVLESRYGGQWDDGGVDEEELGTDSDEIKIEDVPFGPEQEKTASIPLAKSADGGGWKEEPLLEEEPVFYEEPV